MVPVADLRVVAQFEPGPSVGQVDVGQSAVLRLDAFPWTEHGVVRAHVSSVARELRGGLLRVELQIDEAPVHLDLGHGMSGELTVRTG